tara:strand:+ start:340 stop:666 length:327 start_codon:yes stop_codon:yes gene_type:complete
VEGIILETLGTGGPLGCFALYLLVSQRKLQERSDQAIGELRSRYDQVVSKQDATIDQLTLQIGVKIDRLMDKVGVPQPPPVAPSGATLMIERKVAEAIEAAMEDKQDD